MNIENWWSYEDLVRNIRQLKEEYVFCLSFFSSQQDVKLENEYKRFMRNRLYSLNVKEDFIDRCWEYLNGDSFYYQLRVRKELRNEEQVHEQEDRS